MAKKVLVILAEGFEEIEAVTVIDVLRRAGVEVTIAGISGKITEGAHGINVEGDMIIDSVRDVPDLLVLPGGMPGAQNLAKSEKVSAIIKRVTEGKKLIGAICAAPAVVLGPAGVLDKKKMTCFPGFEKNLPATAQFSTDRVVVDGNVITSRGPGTALEFALELVAQLEGKEKADQLREGMLVRK